MKRLPLLLVMALSACTRLETYQQREPVSVYPSSPADPPTSIAPAKPPAPPAADPATSLSRSWVEALRAMETSDAAAWPLTRADAGRLAHALKAGISREDAAALLHALMQNPPAPGPAGLNSVLATLSQRTGGTLRLSDLAATLSQVSAGPRPAHQLESGPDIVLFDGRLGADPVAQQWWFLADPPGGRAHSQAEPAAIRLNTLGQPNDKAGYFTHDPVSSDLLRHPGLPVLSRRAGFSLFFDAQLEQESHSRDDRAGFSVIVITDDQKGLELGFWMNQVWAQSDAGPPLFQDSRAESAAWTAPAQPIRFELAVRGNRYTLRAGSKPLLKGPLRDYTRFGGFPYTQPNFIFLGDDTGSAAASVLLAYVAVRPDPAGLGFSDAQLAKAIGPEFDSALPSVAEPGFGAAAVAGAGPTGEEVIALAGEPHDAAEPAGPESDEAAATEAFGAGNEPSQAHGDGA
jgi:hypothetical protein